MIGTTASGRQGDFEYIVIRQFEAERRNARLAEAVQRLETILAVGLGRDADVALGEARGEPTVEDLPVETRAGTAPDLARFDPPPSGFLAAHLPGAAAKHAAAVQAAQAEFEAALAKWQRRKARQDDAMAQLNAEVRAHNAQIEALQAALRAGEPEAVKRKAELVLLSSPYPKGFHKELKTKLAPGRRKIAVSLRAPTMAEVVPRAERFKFVKSEDRILASRRPEPARLALYERIVSQMALRTFHEVFSTDIGGHIGTIRLNLYAVTVDPNTGKTAKSSLLAARVSRSQLEDIDLARVEPAACLRRLAGPDALAVHAPVEGP
jgi:restriction system protein